MQDFVSAPSTVRIDGTWKKEPAIMYTNYDSKVVVICEPDGRFWSTFVMQSRQRWHLWHDDMLGGG
jgi:hypothetical protein